MQHQSDAQLLREYAARGDEPAFGEIVARHTNLVHSAALRQGGSPEAAREIAQSVFIDLARKARTLAGQLSPHASLAGWLYCDTRFVALHWHREERRREAHHRLVMENFDPSSEASPDWDRVAPVLDEAMADLNDTDREAVLLRFFQNQDFAAVGRALGVSDDAAQKRVSRAVERLREFLAKRGVTVGASGLVILISTNAIQAAPAGLAATLSGTTLACAAKGSGTTSTLLKLMAMTKLKIGIISAVVLVGVGIPLGMNYLGEPSYGGKTVTQWLESLEFYTYKQTTNGLVGKLRAPEAIAADPAVLALAQIGPRAIPVLMHRISEPAEFPEKMSRRERWKALMEWKLFQKPGPRGYWPEVQQRRKTAAGFALLALGTNAGGGFLRFMEAYVAAPYFTSVAGGQLTGLPIGVASLNVVQAANAGASERRPEMIAEVMAALEHTNAIYCQSALEAARVFPEELLKRKNLLLRLTLDEREYVKAAALGNLMTIAQKPALRELMSLAEIRQAAEAVLEAPSTSERNRGMARNVIRTADKQSEK